MSAQTRLDYVVIRVANIETSTRYFTETLGFTLVSEESGPNFSYLKGAPGGIDFGLMPVSENVKAGHVELYFKTPDLEGMREELLSKGIEASQIMHPPFGTIFTVQSPDGETLTMMGA
jgi:catechol 2,3-dioxygenase-like lactoylglutathione lyase family enzyme